MEEERKRIGMERTVDGRRRGDERGQGKDGRRKK